jgi:uncharacterized protein
MAEPNTGPHTRVFHEGVPVFKDLLEYITKLLVENPDQVIVEMIEDPDAIRLTLHVAAGDLGRVIGKEGRTARALRTILHAAAARLHRRVTLEIAE